MLIERHASREVKPLAAHGRRLHADAKHCDESLARQPARSALPIRMPQSSLGGQMYAQDLLYTYRKP